jgi:hypothetical protein
MGNILPQFCASRKEKTGVITLFRRGWEMYGVSKKPQGKANAVNCAVASGPALRYGPGTQTRPSGTA